MVYLLYRPLTLFQDDTRMKRTPRVSSHVCAAPDRRVEPARRTR